MNDGNRVSHDNDFGRNPAVEFLNSRRWRQMRQNKNGDDDDKIRTAAGDDDKFAAGTTEWRQRGRNGGGNNGMGVRIKEWQ